VDCKINVKKSKLGSTADKIAKICVKSSIRCAKQSEMISENFSAGSGNIPVAIKQEHAWKSKSRLGVPMRPPPLMELDGQAINVSDLNQAVDLIIERLAYATSFLVLALNLDGLVKRRRSPELREAYARAEFVTADGFPIVALGHRRGCRLQRATGADLIEPLCAAAARRGLPVFFIGSTFPVLSASARRLITSCPGLQISGVYAPPPNFTIDSAFGEEAIALVRESGARLCFVALGAPLQERFALRALTVTSSVAFIAVGAGLDFLAGARARCPRILQRANLEWAWRLINEPRRLWLRYARCVVLLVELWLNELRNGNKRQLIPNR
jgi:N-acetylglucosaminyldiphosphoundecaprenol N-acetyl-beta-D-mannosaminyltransferase